MGITDKLKDGVKKATDDLRDRQSTRAEGQHEDGAEGPAHAEGGDQPGAGEEARNPTQVELERARAESREQSAEREAEASRRSP
jgi:hypothetical protein